MSGEQAASPAPASVEQQVPSNVPENSSNEPQSGSENVQGETASLATADEIDAAEASGELSSKEAASLKKKLKIKVDGEEFEEEIDWADEEKIKTHLQKSKAFDKRVKDFSAYKNQVEQVMGILEKDPEMFLEKMGVNVEEFLKASVSKRLKEMEKSPEQVQKEKFEKELQEAREEASRLKQEKETAEMEKLRSKISDEIKEGLSAAFESKQTILNPKDPRFVYRVAQVMDQAIDRGYTNVTIEDAIKVVDKQFREETRFLFDNSPEELIEEYVGKHNLEKLRKKRLANRPKTDTANQLVKDQGIKSVREDDSNKGPKREFNKFFTMHDD